MNNDMIEMYTTLDNILSDNVVLDFIDGDWSVNNQLYYLLQTLMYNVDNFEKFKAGLSGVFYYLIDQRNINAHTSWKYYCKLIEDYKTIYPLAIV